MRMSVLNMTQFPGYLSKDYLPLIQGPPFSFAQGPQGYSTSLTPRPPPLLREFLLESKP